MTLDNDPLTPARKRAAQHKTEIAAEAGDMLSPADVMALLGISTQELESYRQEARILGVRGDADWKYPAIQFKDRCPLPRLQEVLKAHHGIDGWIILDSLIVKDSVLGVKSVIDLLVADESDLLDRAIREIDMQYKP